MVSEIWAYILSNIYLRFLFTLLVALIIGVIVKLIVNRVLRPLALKTKTKIDDLIIKSISSVVFYVILALGFKIGFQHFEFESNIFNGVIDTLLIMIVSILILKVIANFAEHWAEDWAKKTESTADDRLIPLLEKLLKALVIILATIFIFDVWKINITPLLTTAGIAGIAISFAVKDTLANIFGGLQLVIDRTFKVGDKVSLESGEMGQILDIGLRSTKLRTFDNEVVYIPNGQLANTRIKNFTVPDLSVRVNVSFGVEYGSDSDHVRQVILDAIGKLEGVLDHPPPRIHFTNMGDSSLDFVARVWVKDYTEAYGMQIRLRDGIYKALNQAGIGIPFPTRTVYTKSMDEESGD
ncbi:MAG: mechanosensitive ion channel [Candidatus Aminicenantes bacterium]|nr:mechanosensitive ion channel [Candidatus Aminicenantes bacterium]